MDLVEAILDRSNGRHGWEQAAQVAADAAEDAGMLIEKGEL